MGIVTGGLDICAASLAGSANPTDIAIGTSGVAYASGQTSLGVETDRNQINTRDTTTPATTNFIANFTPFEISGTILREFGTFNSGNVMLDRQVLNGSLVFDGEQELQIQDSVKFFISG